MLEKGALYSLDVSFIQDDPVISMFLPSELMHLTVGLLAKLESEIAEKIEECREQADSNRDIDS
jgi:hypothetical protein